jgi:hypothetical protein
MMHPYYYTYPNPSYFPPNHYYVPHPHHTAYRPYPYQQRPLPPVNPSLFMTSAKDMEVIMKDASILLEKMARSKKFSLDLMTAAQNSNQDKVNEMVKNTGVKTVPKVSYTPDGLKLDFSSYAENPECCHLSLSLRWM